MRSERYLIHTNKRDVPRRTVSVKRLWREDQIRSESGIAARRYRGPCYSPLPRRQCPVCRDSSIDRSRRTPPCSRLTLQLAVLPIRSRCGATHTAWPADCTSNPGHMADRRRFVVPESVWADSICKYSIRRSAQGSRQSPPLAGQARTKCSEQSNRVHVPAGGTVTMPAQCHRGRTLLSSCLGNTSCCLARLDARPMKPITMESAESQFRIKRSLQIRPAAVNHSRHLYALGREAADGGSSSKSCDVCRHDSSRC